MNNTFDTLYKCTILGIFFYAFFHFNYFTVECAAVLSNFSLREYISVLTFISC